MDQNNAVTVIEKLTEICKDGEKGYKEAAEHAKRSDLKTLSATQSSERGHATRLVVKTFRRKDDHLSLVHCTGEVPGETTIGAMQFL